MLLLDGFNILLFVSHRSQASPSSKKRKSDANHAGPLKRHNSSFADQLQEMTKEEDGKKGMLVPHFTCHLITESQQPMKEGPTNGSDLIYH